MSISGILFSNKKEGRTNAHYGMEELQTHSAKEARYKDHTLHSPVDVKCPRKAKRRLKRQEINYCLPGGGEGSRNNYKWVQASFWGDKK